MMTNQADDRERWLRHQASYGWAMPMTATWKRWPLIRHLRAIRLKRKIEQWYSAGPGSLGVRGGYDDWVAAGIWYGWE